jgi:hypothetical protein
MKKARRRRTLQVRVALTSDMNLRDDLAEPQSKQDDENHETFDLERLCNRCRLWRDVHAGVRI